MKITAVFKPRQFFIAAEGTLTQEKILKGNREMGFHDALRNFLYNTKWGKVFNYKTKPIREWYLLKKYDDKEYLELLYKKRYGKQLNLVNPTAFTEKLQWLKLFYRDSIMHKYSDKYAAREYMAELGYGGLLNELIGIYENASEIDPNKMPEQFALKANHGSGWNLICKSKKNVDWSVWKSTANSWLKMNCYVFGREWNYKDIKPLLIIEKYISYSPLIDYKFMCFNGEPKMIQVNHDMSGAHYVDFYSMEWERLNLTYQPFLQSEILLDKPDEFDEMVELSKKLSAPFPFVRVDLYNFEKKIMFGEMTFFPSSGMWPFVPPDPDYDALFGSWLKLPEPNYNIPMLAEIRNM